ncbi:MAG: hypothetical protein Cons2KO_23830 [Congregibacter sp.]
MLRGLAQYRVLSCLGSGAQGSVFLALDTRLSRRVAIKTYRIDASRRQRRKVLREAWLLTRADSERLTRVFDVVSHGKDLALVCQFVPGVDLGSLCREMGALPVAMSFSILADIASALAGLRRARLTHGDLRPENVIITPEGRAVLTDFGLARTRGESSTTFSRDALAPEQLDGEPIDLRSDFFALGMLAFRMLYARHPFYRGENLELQRLRRGMRAEDMPELLGCDAVVSSAVYEFLARLMARSPEQRFQSTFDLREAIREIRQRLPAAVPPRAALAPDVFQRLFKARRREDLPLELPPRLVNLPFLQHAAVWLKRYWLGGSAGARLSLFLALLTPGIVTALMAAQPGSCVRIAKPEEEFALRFTGRVPTSQQLQSLLTRQLKLRSPSLVVLGRGEFSDSKPFLTPLGMQDICTPQRSLRLDLTCKEEVCAMRIRSVAPGQSRTTATELASSASLRDYASSIDAALDTHLLILAAE